MTTTTTPTAAAVRTSLGIAHMVASTVLAELPADVARRRFEGATIGPIAPILAHAAFGEDWVLNEAIGREPLLTRGGFLERTGIPSPDRELTREWLDAAYDIGELQRYAGAVFAEVTAWAEAASEADWARRVPSPLGTEMTMAELLPAFGAGHVMLHAGEISALKGIQGLPGGLPM